MYQEVSEQKILKCFDHILPELFSKNIFVETTCKSLITQVVDRIDQEKVITEIQNLQKRKAEHIPTIPKNQILEKLEGTRLTPRSVINR